VKLPFWPTLLVAAAVAVMAGLGIWQLQRMGEKEALIARYQQASRLPAAAWPSVPPKDDSLLFRKAEGFCTEVVGWRAIAGRNVAGESGWSHIAACRTGGLEGPGMQVDMGWSKSSADPAGWRGGEVSGVIAPDRDFEVRLISARAAPGFQPSAPPAPELTPNNHLYYAIQWFFFAFAAALIYWLALRKRQRKGAAVEPGGGTH
jgi:cytochrome oxidase assembly protein ShyY1